MKNKIKDIRAILNLRIDAGVNIEGKWYKRDDALKIILDKLLEELPDETPKK